MLRSILVVAILVPGLIAAIRSRFAALLLYLWWALFRPDQWLWFNVSAFRPSLVLGLLLAVPCIISGILPNLTHPLSIGAVLFLASGLVAQVNAVNPEVGWSWLDYFSRLLVVALLCVSLVRTRQQFLTVAAVIAGSFGFHAAKAGFMSLLFGGLRFGEGLSGAFVDNNGYALGTAMIIPFLIVTAQNLRQRWLRTIVWICVPFSILTVVSTYSRGGALALAACFFVFLWLQRRRAIALVAAAAVIGLGVAFYDTVLPAAYIDRISSINSFEEAQDESALGRLHFWRVAIEMANQKPLGIGLRNFESTYDRFDTSEGRYGHNRAVHSSHFEVLAENGYFGAAVWTCLFLYAFVISTRVRTRSRDPRLDEESRRFLFTAANALAMSMTAFLVGGAFIALSLNDLTWLTFALVAALDRVSLSLVKDLSDDALPQPVRPVFTPSLGRPAVSAMGTHSRYQ